MPERPRFATRTYQAPERTVFDDMKDSLRAGVKTVSAPQLFPTPAPLAARVVQEAGIQPGHTVLEPSAGTGALLEAIRVAGGTPTGVEISQGLCQILRQRFEDIREADFLQCNGDLGTFDRVVMNPPFADGQDVQHVTHALHMVKPGGRLVAVMSAGVTFRQDRRTSDFRALVERHGGSIEALPDDSFAQSGTGVRTVLVTIDL